MGWPPGSQDLPNYSADSQLLPQLACTQEVRRNLIKVTTFTGMVGGYDQDLVVARKYPPTLTSLTETEGIDWCQNLKKEFDT
jgi:hypothetical protein